MQTAADALAYAGRYRTYPGALVGMKPPQFSAWMFARLGALPGDELVDLFPGLWCGDRRLAALYAFGRHVAGIRGQADATGREDLDERGRLALVLSLDSGQLASGPSDTSRPLKASARAGSLP